jgi:hypothetical protein
MIDNQPAVLLLPISPTALFYASRDRMQQNHIRDLPESGLVKEVNKHTAAWATTRVFALNAQHEPLLKKWLSMYPPTGEAEDTASLIGEA